MGKSISGKELGKGLGQRKDGLYYARYKDDSEKWKEKCFKKLSDAPLYFLPNRINDAEGTKTEREQRIDTIKVLGQLGTVAPRIKQSVVIKRFTTLYALDTYQTRAVEHSFDKIISKLE